MTMRAMAGAGVRAAWKIGFVSIGALVASAGTAHADAITSAWTFRYQDVSAAALPVRLGQVSVFDEDPDGAATFRQIGPFGTSGPFPFLDTGFLGTATLELDNFEVGGIDPQGRVEAHAEIGAGAVKQVLTVRGPGTTNDPDGRPLPGDFRIGASTVQLNQNADFAQPVVTNLPGNATDIGKAFAIFDAMITGARYADHLGSAGTFVNVISPFTGTFAVDDGAGTYRIYVRSDDAFDWDVMVHELGHVISTANKFDDSPGGDHNFDEILADVALPGGAVRDGKKLAWSEGFANYYQAAAQDYENGLVGSERLPDVKESAGGPSIRDTITLYMDEVDASLSWDIESRGTLKDGGAAVTEAHGDRNELAVARVLWDLMDGTGGTEGAADEVTLGHRAVFDLARTIRNPTDPAADQHGAFSLEDFEKSVLASTASARRKTQLGAIFAEHRAAPRAVRAAAPGMPIIPAPFAANVGDVSDLTLDLTGVSEVPGGVLGDALELPDPDPDASVPTFRVADAPPTFEWLAPWALNDPTERYRLQFFAATSALAVPLNASDDASTLADGSAPVFEIALIDSLDLTTGLSCVAGSLGDRCFTPSLTFWRSLTLGRLGSAGTPFTIFWNLIGYFDGQDPSVDGVWGNLLAFKVVAVAEPGVPLMASMALILVVGARWRRCRPLVPGC